MLEEIIFAINEALNGTYPIYKTEAVQQAKDVGLVLQQKYPAQLLDIVRPNEPDKVKDYRASVYEPIIQGDFAKVVTTLQKIRLSDGFAIEHSQESESFEGYSDYLTKNFPLTYSFENWVFNFMLQRKLVDANAICIVYPSNFDKPEEEPKPFPYLFDSSSVLIDTKELIACIDRSTKEGVYIVAVTDMMFYHIFKPHNKGNIEAIELEHNIGDVPSFKLAGILKSVYNEQPLYSSFVSPCLPFWREAIRRRSDHQASMIMHVNPEKWQYTNRQCKACKSKGVVNGTSCDNCGGSGYELVSSPFGVHTIHPEKVSLTDAAPVVTPPAGYILKPTDDVKFLGDEVKEQLYYALRAINLEFLGQEYLNQSGTAKEMDRQEVKSFLFQVAQSLIEANIKPCLKYLTGWWFKGMSDDVKAQAMPKAKIPKDFDVLSATILRTRVESLKNANFNPSIVAQAEKEYFAKEYGKDNIEYKILSNAIDLDPLQGKSEEIKQGMLLQGAIDKQTYIVSTRTRDFIKRAIEQNAGFFELSRQVKQQILYDIARTEIARQNINLLPIE